MSKVERPEEVLECLGYFGFGGGWVGGRMALKGQQPTGESYCVYCPLNNDCWQRHENRVRSMFPNVAKALDGLAGETGLHGQKLHLEFERRFATRSPVMAVMAGNIEDGLAVGAGGFPADRERFTLPYPFREEQRV